MPLKPEYNLRGHQDHAVDTALKRNGNIIFSHPVGSGKTLTSIATFEKMKEQGLAKRALVVTPASLRSNYGENGVHKFTDSTFKIYGNKQEIGSDTTGIYAEPHDHGPEYGVVSYELFRENPEKYIKGHYRTSTKVPDVKPTIVNKIADKIGAGKARNLFTAGGAAIGGLGLGGLYYAFNSATPAERTAAKDAYITKALKKHDSTINQIEGWE